MKYLQIVVVKFLSLAAVVCGIVLIGIWFHAGSLSRVIAFLQQSERWMLYGYVPGALLVVCGVLGLLPLARHKRRKTISFSGVHGEVTLQLDSVEATIMRVVGKMPEVKKIWIKVTPSDDNHRARVYAEVLMYKGVEGAGARELANRIEDRLHDTAVNLLGSDVVTSVSLNIRGIVLNLPRKAPEEKHETPLPAAAPELPAVEPEPEKADAAPVEFPVELAVAAPEARGDSLASTAFDTRDQGEPEDHEERDAQSRVD